MIMVAMMNEKNMTKSMKRKKDMKNTTKKMNTKKIMGNMGMMITGIKMNIRVEPFMIELLKKYLVTDCLEKLLFGQKIKYQNLSVLSVEIL